MTQLQSTLTNVLKEYYLPPIQDQLNNNILVLQLLDLESKQIDLEGLKAVVPLHHKRSSGVGSRRENEALPAAGKQAYEKATFELAYHYARIAVSGQAEMATRTDAGAFLRAWQSELDGIKDDLMLDFARQVYGNKFAIAGAIAKVASIAGSVATLTSDEALQKEFLYVGMVIDVGSTAILPRDQADSVTITDLSVANKTITVSSAGSIAANGYIFREDGNDASGTKEMTSLQDIINVTAGVAVGGLDPDTAGLSVWDNQRDDIDGAASLSALLENSNRVTARGAQSDELLVLQTPGLTRRLFESPDFKDSVRFVNSQRLRGGFGSLEFDAGSGPMTVVSDRLAPYGHTRFIHKKHLKMFSPADWDFLARDGQAVKWVQDKDAFQSILFRYSNLGTGRRNTSLVMFDQTDDGF